MVINSIYKVLFVLKAAKHIVIDPDKYQGPIFSALACRFTSSIQHQGFYDDMALVALGNSEQVLIMEARPSLHSEFLSLSSPKEYYNVITNSFEPFKAGMPALCWGYGMTPGSSRPHSLLAVAWGPLIQLIKLIDYEDTETPLQLDGYYIIK